MFHYQNKAAARVQGGKDFPRLRGHVFFEQLEHGVLITARITGLPEQDGERFGVFGFHIHDGSSCTGTPEDEFSNTLGHYNPQEKLHPYHAGDLPPLFSNNGSAYMQVLTDRFSLQDIIGKTVVIHNMPDDFKTQPAGDSGKKIACGKIIRTF